MSDIASLIENAPYEVSTAVKLEAFVTQQLAQRTYDFTANKALMKNYQVNHEQCKLEVVCHLLVLSLMRLPANDFIAISYMIPAKCVNHARITAIQECANLLERGHFLGFWEHFLNAPEGLFTSAVGFVDFIRMFILSTLRNTYTAIPKKLFAEQLGLNETSIEAFCEGNKFIEKVRISNFFKISFIIFC